MATAGTSDRRGSDRGEGCLEGFPGFRTGYRHGTRPRVGHHPRERILHPARPFGLRQDHASAPDRRLRFPDRGRNPPLWRGHRAAAALQAAGQHGVPELRALPAHDGCPEYRLRPRDAGQAEGRNRRARRPRCCGWCAWKNCRNRKTSQISGGQQQRVALARALAPQPKVLLLDEPLSALDYKLRKDMQIELKRLQHETGITFIFVTHDQEEALTMSDRIAVMSKGQHPAGRHAARHLRPAGRALRRQFHRRDEFPRRRRSCQRPRARPRSSSPRAPTISAGLPEGFKPHRPGDRGGAAGTCRRDRSASPQGHAHRHAREHRLFRHRHALSRDASRTAASSSCASRTAGRDGTSSSRATQVGIAFEDDAAQVLRD